MRFLCAQYHRNAYSGPGKYSNWTSESTSRRGREGERRGKEREWKRGQRKERGKGRELEFYALQPFTCEK